jgi:hypothetical protein
MIEHGQVEAELRSLVVKQVTTLFGKTVWRLDKRHWCIDGGAPLRLLLAIDALMKRHGFVFDVRAGQDSSIF